LQSSKLTRLLLANSAHEVRTPLNAIINYLEIALEGSLDQETRENLARSHSASKSLIYVINDLLDLTKTEEGQGLVKDEIFELPLCIKEATEPFEKDTARKGVKYEVIEHPGLPRFVYGDGRRVRQAISNVTANAVAHTNDGYVKIEVFVSELRERQAIVDIVVADSGLGMSAHQLDALFRDLEQVSTEEPEPASQGGRVEDVAQTRTLGLGLAVVARTIRNMDGQLRLKSEEGQGSRFVIQLPFQLPDESPSSVGEGDSSGTLDNKSTIASAPADVTAAREGELILVERGSMMNLSAEPEKHLAGFEAGSSGSRRSMESQGSHASHQSDAERLINAIQTPLSLHDREPEYPVSLAASKGSSQRPTSKGSITLSKTSTSIHSQEEQRSSPSQSRHDTGFASIRDSKTPIRAVKIPDEFADMPAQWPQPTEKEKSGVLFEMPGEPRSSPKAAPESLTSGTTSGTTTDGQHLQILIAEDDPINMKIMRKRLERAGHEVTHAVNGEDCATVYKEKSADFDVVLMDMQVSGLFLVKFAYEGANVLYKRCRSWMGWPALR
jgi:CheY-like chemotaxis protein